MSEPGKTRTVAVADPLWAGHHPMYFAQFTASFLRNGARVIGLCPDPADARRELGETSASCVHLEALQTGGRSFFNGRFEGDPVRTFRRWKAAAQALDQAEAVTGWRTDLVFFPYLDSYLRFLPFPSVPEITLGRPWAGLYLRNHHFGNGRNPLVHCARLLGKGDPLLRSNLCRGIGVLDERFTREMESHSGHRVTPFPDVTHTELPEHEPDIVRRIREKAAGRPIVGIIGLEKRKGALTMLRTALRASEIRHLAYFVFAGVFPGDLFDPSGRQLFLDTHRRIEAGEIDHIHFEPDAKRIPAEADYNALFKIFSIAWAAYEGFQGSSGTLSKAAAFEIPVIASAGECVGNRVEHYRTGITIPEGDVAAALAAIDTLLDGQPPGADHAAYRADHSIEKLDAILADLLAGVA